jgi:hypothetical protein
MRQRTVKRRTLWSVQALPPFRKDVLPDKKPQRDRLVCVLGLSGSRRFAGRWRRWPQGLRGPLCGLHRSLYGRSN